MNLVHALEATASRTPDAVALEFQGMSITYGGLDAEVRRAAAGLAGLGVERGDRVALWLGNHPAFAVAMYATWRCGAVIVPLHAMLTEPEATHAIADSGAKVIVCSEAQFGAGAGRIAETVASVEHCFVGGDELANYVPSANDPMTPIVEVGDDDLALIAYTSGTSGVPKGAMLTHGNLRSNLEQMQQTPVGVRPDDVVLCVLPLFHIFGLNVVLNLSVSVGARIVLFERFDPAASIAAIRAGGVTVVAGAPTVYVTWLEHGDVPADAFAGVRVAVSGAAPLDNETFTAFRDRFGVTIRQGYGLTETSPALTWASGDQVKPGSVGRALPGVELRLVDEDGEEAEDGDPGEVCVRGPNVFTGYWKSPDETAKAFDGDWFKTGDVGVRDDDGDLYLVDRRRDLIIVSGFNVYPREVEDVLRRHPHVGDVAVVGALDARTGESVRAIVVADPPGESVEAGELLEFCRASLAPYKLPGTIEFVSNIPRNAAGKVLRRALRN